MLRARYAAKPQAVLDEDKVIGAMKLGIKPESAKITPAAQAFAEINNRERKRGARGRPFCHQRRLLTS
jgi:hypothetical protein